MNYSEKISKISYTTSIGDFKVSDITSYFVLDSKYVQPTEINVDNFTTLLELSNKIYNNQNSFWLFLYANDTINPFTLLQTSTEQQLQSYSENATSTISYSSTGIETYLKPGSLIFNRTANTGSSYGFGGTGSFSLTGGYALVYGYDTYAKKAFLKDISGITLLSGTNPPLTGIIKGNTYYSPGDTLSPAGSTQLKNDIAFIKYKSGTVDSYRSYADVLGSQPFLAKASIGEEPPYQFSGEGVCYSYQDFATTEEKRITYFVPNKLDYSNFTQIVQNYIV